jgi:hypothetical protein
MKLQLCNIHDASRKQFPQSISLLSFPSPPSRKKIPSAAFTRIFPWLVFDRQDIHSLGTRPPWSLDKRAAPMRGKDKRNQNKKLRRWTPEKKQEQLLFLFSPDGKYWFDRGEV